MSVGAEPPVNEPQTTTGNPLLAISDSDTGADRTTAANPRPNEGWLRGVKRSLENQTEMATGAEDANMPNGENHEKSKFPDLSRPRKLRVFRGTF